MELTRPSNRAITYGTYPTIALLTAAVVAFTLRNDLNRSAVAALLAIVPIVVAVIVEWRYPLGPEWRMTKASLLSRDLPFIVLAIVTQRLAETLAVLAAAAVVATDGFGPLARLPLGVQVVVTLLVFDLLWYGYHRAAHSHKRLWRVHGVHHAPAQLYALMHLVFHPFDLLASRFLVAAIAFQFTGATSDAIFIAVVIIGLQQMISHVNADLRVGPLTTRATTIEAAELAKIYGDGTRALAGISFTAEAGEIFGLLGPNGSGKTTAVRVFVTLLQATSGAARVAGYDVGRDRERVRQLIGYSGQYVGVDQDLTVMENLILSGRLHGLSESQARGRSDELVERLGLGGVAGQRAGRLSGGMRRRLDLAQAMVHRPAALFLDEPTTGLDPQARNALWEELRALSAAGTTILLTTQYLEEADRLCGRVAILNRGRILTVGTPTALKDAAGEDRVTLTLAEPGDPDQRALVQSVAAQVPGVLNVRYGQQEVTMQLHAAGDALLELIRRLDLEGVDVARLRLAPTTLDDVFVAYTGESPRSEVESGRRPSSVFAAIHGRTSR